jgi:uncharacterized protein YraI
MKEHLKEAKKMYARKNSPEQTPRMSRLNTLVLVSALVAALLLPAVGLGQQDVNMAVAGPIASLREPNAPATPVGPYVAEVTGDDVLVRSGPGTNFYQCGKLYRGDRVQVVNTQQGWSCIVPPPGCFSWIGMQYVSINLDNPTMGIITGNDVRIYAGSDYVEPMHSTSEQVRLARGSNVKLLGEEKDDYYKIAPPQGAYLWISSEYLRAASGTGGATVGIRPVAGTPAQGPETQAPTTEEAKMIQAYYALSDQMKAEHEKPLGEQSYDEIKAKLQELAKNEAAGKAARYAEFTLKQIDRFELAAAVAKEVELQNKELTKVTDKIDEARQARLAQIEDLGRFAVTGTLEGSSLYGTAEQTRRYRILDADGKTVCYIAPVGAAAGQDYSQLIGKKVGVVGDIEPHEATARAFIKFTQIVPLD